MKRRARAHAKLAARFTLLTFLHYQVACAVAHRNKAVPPALSRRILSQHDQRLYQHRTRSTDRPYLPENTLDLGAQEDAALARKLTWWPGFLARHSQGDRVSGLETRKHFDQVDHTDLYTVRRDRDLAWNTRDGDGASVEASKGADTETQKEALLRLALSAGSRPDQGGALDPSDSAPHERASAKVAGEVAAGTPEREKVAADSDWSDQDKAFDAVVWRQQRKANKKVHREIDKRVREREEQERLEGDADIRLQKAIADALERAGKPPPPPSPPPSPPPPAPKQRLWAGLAPPKKQKKQTEKEKENEWFEEMPKSKILQRRDQAVPLEKRKRPAERVEEDRRMYTLEDKEVPLQPHLSDELRGKRKPRTTPMDALDALTGLVNGSAFRKDLQDGYAGTLKGVYGKKNPLDGLRGVAAGLSKPMVMGNAEIVFMIEPPPGATPADTRLSKREMASGSATGHLWLQAELEGILTQWKERVSAITSDQEIGNMQTEDHWLGVVSHHSAGLAAANGTGGEGEEPASEDDESLLTVHGRFEDLEAGDLLSEERWQFRASSEPNSSSSLPVPVVGRYRMPGLPPQMRPSAKPSPAHPYPNSIRPPWRRFLQHFLHARRRCRGNGSVRLLCLTPMRALHV
ncbi:hypothetical protein CYMTET_31568 [Cymbomonas tetramitiformis]|uniref:Uncharacterized protein n=1 Tax=Cymbomonas tetramitiformis TaxID=36881 RepID=A0AAE0FGQ3_9CHLO|nr:hypothetical protein CYMTET_31568 [Cymbomonas tetramitiformis]